MITEKNYFFEYLQTVKEIELCQKVHGFLLKHEKNPFHVMSIDEFGKLKGGFYLVKQLSQAGYALKPFRKIYADYLQTQYKKIS
tara:strand:- start:228 stop:479 length:252 start_codon:yes stop_codon:yes gene_type:complete